MEHFLFAAYILLFASGSSGIAALAIMSVREKNPVIRRLLKLQIWYFLGLAAEISFYYVRVNIADSGGLLNGFAICANLIQAGLYFAAFQAMSELRSSRKKIAILIKAGRFLCLLVTAASFSGSIYFILRFAGIHVEIIKTVLSSGICYALIGVSLAILAVCLLCVPPEDAPLSVRFLVRGWGVSLLLFVPLTMLEFFLKTAKNLSYTPVSLDTVFYVCCSVVSVAACIKNLRAENLPAKSSRQGLLFEISRETATRFELTEREREMVPLIARGLGNKQIAAELGISPATVRTHIYNLFQKTGARSRIEMLNRL